MKTTTLIAIALLLSVSCQDDEQPQPQGTAYDMAGTYNVTYTPVNGSVRYVTMTVQPLSSNRALLVYNPYIGNSGLQQQWLWPNDTIDFGADSFVSIGPDTFMVNGSQIIHKAGGSYTQNTITIPQHRHTMLFTTYYSRIEAVR